MTHITPRLSVSGPDDRGYYPIYADDRFLDSLTRAEADTLIAALNPWRPIASAPTELKDGRRFLGGWQHRVYGWLWSWARWQDDKHVEGGGYFVMGEGGEPTHYLPLPAPPSHDAGQATDGGERQWERA